MTVPSGDHQDYAGEIKHLMKWLVYLFWGPEEFGGGSQVGSFPSLVPPVRDTMEGLGRGAKLPVFSSTRFSKAKRIPTSYPLIGIFPKPRR